MAQKTRRDFLEQSMLTAAAAAVNSAMTPFMREGEDGDMVVTVQ